MPCPLSFQVKYPCKLFGIICLFSPINLFSLYQCGFLDVCLYFGTSPSSTSFIWLFKLPQLWAQELTAGGPWQHSEAQGGCGFPWLPLNKSFPSWCQTCEAPQARWAPGLLASLVLWPGAMHVGVGLLDFCPMTLSQSCSLGHE